MSSLEDLYREVILDHYRAPRNRGELASPPAIKSEGKNPVCGDELTLFLDVQDGIVRDIKMSGIGCSISMASASMMTAAIKGKPVEFAREIIVKFKELMDIHESALEKESGSNQATPSTGGSLEKTNLGELEALTGVVKFPVRIKCATLAFNTLGNGLDSAQGQGASNVASSE